MPDVTRPRDYTAFPLLKRRMARMGVTQKDLAEKLGTSQGCVCLWLKGDVTMNRITIMGIAEALEIPAYRIGEYFFPEMRAREIRAAIKRKEKLQKDFREN